MRRIITLILLFYCVFIACGSAKNDSIKVYFDLNKSTLDLTLGNNAALMEKFINGIIVSARSGNLENIDIYGYASPEGPFLNNNRLSAQRCKVIADFIRKNAELPENTPINLYPEGVAWENFRTLVSESVELPHRDAAINIINKYLPAARTDKTQSDECIKSLMAIDDGRTYDWMLKNIFPKLRYSLSVYTYNVPDSLSVHPILKTLESGLFDLQMPQPDDIEVAAPSSIYVDRKFYRPYHRLAIKTNLLNYAALLPNIEVEWLINPDWSVALEYDGACWGKYSKERSYRIGILMPEVKRWIRPRAPWNGFYAGLFAGGGLYDFEKGIPGRYGEGVMGGLSVGYMWPISRCLSLEAAIGAGYLYTRYKEYIPLDGHHVYQRTKDLNYFGPLKVKFSFVWRLWDTNKSARLNAKKEMITQYE